MPSAVTSIFAQQAVEFCASLSVEFLTFAMTVVFALVIKMVGNWGASGCVDKLNKEHAFDVIKQHAFDVIKAGKARVAPPSGTAEAPAATEDAQQPRQRNNCGALGAMGIVHQRGPWMIISSIMTTMQEHPNQRSAAHCLQLYSDLRHLTGIGTTKTARSMTKEFVCEGSMAHSVATAAQRTKYHVGEFYMVLVQCAVRAEQFHLVETLTDDMVAQGITRTFQFYENAMKQLAGQKKYQYALNMYDRLVDDGITPSAVMLSCVISFASEVSDSDRALALYKKLCETSTPSIRAFMTVLRVLAKKQDWVASVATLRQMQQSRVKVDALAINVILSTGIAAGRLKEAEELFSEMEQLTPPIVDRVSYNTMLKGHAQRSDASAAVECVERMKSLGHQPNGITYNTLMDAIVRGNRPLQALGVLDQMRESGIPPDRFTCTIFVKGMPAKPVPEYTQAAVEILHACQKCCDATLLASLYHTVFDSISETDSLLLLQTVSRMRQRGFVLTEAENKRYRKALAIQGEGSALETSSRLRRICSPPQSAPAW